MLCPRPQNGLTASYRSINLFDESIPSPIINRIIYDDFSPGISVHLGNARILLLQRLDEYRLPLFRADSKNRSDIIDARRMPELIACWK